MKHKIGANEYEVVTAEVVKPDGIIIMSDGGRGSCSCGVHGPLAKKGDEFAVIEGRYFAVKDIEQREEHDAADDKKADEELEKAKKKFEKSEAAKRRREEKAAAKKASPKKAAPKKTAAKKAAPKKAAPKKAAKKK